MLINFDRRFLFNAAGEGGAGSGGGGTGAGGAGGQAGGQGGQGGQAGSQAAFTPPDLNNPEAKKWFESHVNGLVKNRDEIRAELVEHKRKFDELQEKLKPLGDLDKASTIFRQLKTDEEKKLVAEGKIDEVIRLRTAEMQQRHTEAVTTKEKELQAAIKAQEKLNTKIRELTIGRALTEVAVKHGVVKTALPDVISRGHAKFTLNDKHEIQALDEQTGVVILAKDGKTPLNPELWIEQLKEEAPHFFPGSGGSGSKGGLQQNANGNIRLPAVHTQKEYEAAKAQAKALGVQVEISG